MGVAINFREHVDYVKITDTIKLVHTNFHIKDRWVRCKIIATLLAIIIIHTSYVY